MPVPALVDSTSADRYKDADLICDGAYASTILLFSSSNFTARREIALGVLDCLTDRKASGEKIGRYHYVEANKYLNSLGGALLLDMLTRQDTYTLVQRHLDKYLRIACILERWEHYGYFVYTRRPPWKKSEQLNCLQVLVVSVWD